MLTIVTPTLNASEFIKKNIHSIDSLDLPLEHIIVDGGSNDGTLSIIEKHLNEKRKLIHQEDNDGMYKGLQMGFQAANGNWFAYINADDQVIKDGFEEMYKMAVATNPDLIYSDGYFHWLNENKYQKVKGRRFGGYHLRNGFLPFLQPSSVYKREIFEQVEGFRWERFKISGDLDLFQRMALKDNFKAKYVPVDSAIFLKYGNSLGDQNTDLYHKEMQQLKQKNRNLFNKVFFKITGLV